MSNTNFSNPFKIIIKNLMIIINGISSLEKEVSEIKNSNNPVKPKRWVTANELYKILPIKSRTLTKYRSEGKITFSKFKGVCLYDAEEVLNEIENNIHPKIN